MIMFKKFLVLIVVLLWSISAYSQESRNLTLVFTTADNQLHPRSIAMNNVLTEALKQMGIKLKIISMPSKRSLLNANKGIEDGNFLRTKGITAKFPNLIRIPEAISVNYIVAFSKDNSIKVNGWKSLNDYHVACVNGWRNCERELPDPKQKTVVKNDKLLFTLLAKDRADVGVFGRDTGLATLKELGVDDIMPLSPPIVISDLFLYIHIQHEPLIPEITQVLRKMKSDGSYQRILENAGLK